jgi:hypothetical protein
LSAIALAKAGCPSDVARCDIFFTSLTVAKTRHHQRTTTNEKSPNVQGSLSGLFKNRAVSRRLLGKFCEFFVELVDTASRVHKFHFSGEKRVTVRRNLHFHERVFFTVFPGDRILRIHAGSAEERVVCRDVFEYHETVTSGMNIFFHDFIFAKICCKPVFSKFEPQK